MCTRIKSRILSLWLCFFVLAALPSFCQSEDEPVETAIDWETRFTQVVDISTERLPNHIKGSKNGFDSLVLAKIRMRKVENPTGQKYETVWFRKGDPVGVRRFGKLPFEAPQKVALRVIHSAGNADDSEIRAAANACLRLYLDLHAHSIAPDAIIVPRASFGAFVQRFNQLNFYSAEMPPPDTPVYTSIVLSVESEPPGQRQLLFYSGRGY